MLIILFVFKQTMHKSQSYKFTPIITAKQVKPRSLSAIA